MDVLNRKKHILSNHARSNPIVQIENRVEEKAEKKHIDVLTGLEKSHLQRHRKKKKRSSQSVDEVTFTSDPDEKFVRFYHQGENNKWHTVQSQRLVQSLRCVRCTLVMFMFRMENV